MDREGTATEFTNLYLSTNRYRVYRVANQIAAFPIDSLYVSSNN